MEPREVKISEKYVKTYATIDRLKRTIKKMDPNYRYIIHRFDSGRYTPIFIINLQAGQQPLDIISRGYMVVG